MNEEFNAVAYLDCADVFLQEEPRWDDDPPNLLMMTSSILLFSDSHPTPCPPLPSNLSPGAPLTDTGVTMPPP